MPPLPVRYAVFAKSNAKGEKKQNGFYIEVNREAEWT